MIRSKTIFILGAGASQEAGLPLGSELKSTIATKLDLRFEHFSTPIGNGDLSIFNALQKKYERLVNDYLAACWRVRDGIGLSDSIDDFIDAHALDQQIAVVGKLAIARSILEAEGNSKLFYRRENISDTVDFRSLGDTWYLGFYSLLANGVRREDLAGIFENVTVISFNYDRCLEHFLVHALARNYHLPIDEVRPIVERLRILRPYGAVGPYFGRPGDIVEFGRSRIGDVDDVLRSIRTYSEKMDDDEGLNAIHNAVADADVVVFLGSAFHENNMALLADGTRAPKKKKIYLTRNGISDADLRVVHRMLGGIAQMDPRRQGSGIGTNLFLADKCCDLFKTYRMSLRS